KLHRIFTKTYSNDPANTPAVTYAYYPGADLKSITSSAATRVYSDYDGLGRFASETQTVGGNTSEYVFGYTYWLNDAIREVSYPSGRTLKYDLDDAGRIKKISALNQTYADTTTATVAWAHDGRLDQTNLGNNLWVTQDYVTADAAPRLMMEP